MPGKQVVPKNAKRVLPVDIPLLENTPLDGGAVFVRLPTLNALESSWRDHQDQFHFAAKAIVWGGQQRFLNEYEWVFAPTKVALVKTFTRWEQVGITCKWYDWAGDTSADVGTAHADWFLERDELRATMMAEGSWCNEDEHRYQADCRRRTPETYRGWWELKNLPLDADWSYDWLGLSVDAELIDPATTAAEVAESMQQLTYDAWATADSTDIAVMDAAGVDDEIAYWRAEQAAGEGYYGEENE
ncbi:hypothetical protein GO286_04215 [Ralstonia solanacearum]|nr:hypothetical protein [Ralstonia solanacearum]